MTRVNRKTNSKSGFKGVQKIGKKWRARIAVEGQMKSIGMFNTKEEAAEAYNKRAVELHNNNIGFLVLNVVNNFNS